MSKMGTATAVKPATLPAEALATLEAGRAALAERERLLALQRKLTADLADARRLVIERNEAVGLADTEVILAGETPPAELVEAAEQARAAARTVADIVVRLEHVVPTLPGLLAQADEAIEAAAEPMRIQHEATFNTGRAAYEVRLRAAVDQLVTVLQLGHALNAANLYGLRTHLEGITIPAPVHGEQPILREGNRLTAADGSMVEISGAWRSNPEAVALYDLHAPTRPMQDALKRETARIAAERQTAQLEGRDRAMAARPPVTTGGQPLPPPPPYTPPPGAGPGRSWTIETRVAAPPISGQGSR